MQGADEVKRTEDVEIEDNISFAEMMLTDAVLIGLTKHNFKNPSPIQLKAIPLGRCGMGKCKMLIVLFSILSMFRSKFLLYIFCHVRNVCGTIIFEQL